jgi:hypothetical protein
VYVQGVALQTPKKVSFRPNSSFAHIDSKDRPTHAMTDTHKTHAHSFASSNKSCTKALTHECVLSMHVLRMQVCRSPSLLCMCQTSSSLTDDLVLPAVQGGCLRFGVHPINLLGRLSDPARLDRLKYLCFGECRTIGFLHYLSL